jgi:hypothetical protein
VKNLINACRRNSHRRRFGRVRPTINLDNTSKFRRYEYVTIRFLQPSPRPTSLHIWPVGLSAIKPLRSFAENPNVPSISGINIAPGGTPMVSDALSANTSAEAMIQWMIFLIYVRLTCHAPLRFQDGTWGTVPGFKSDRSQIGHAKNVSFHAQGSCFGFFFQNYFFVVILIFSLRSGPSPCRDPRRS